MADKTILRLNRRTIKLFEATKNKLWTAKFDELNVIREIKDLYAHLDKENKKEFISLFLKKYEEICGKKESDEYAEYHVSMILEEPHPVTRYAYNAEVFRKRDRATEGINAVPAIEKNHEIEKAMRFWSQMTTWYVDFVSDEANIAALKKMGIQKVVWHKQADEYVCKTCQDMDGNVYSINNIPPKPHPSCRCYVTPYNIIS